MLALYSTSLHDPYPSTSCRPNLFWDALLQMILYYFTSEHVHRSVPYGRKVRAGRGPPGPHEFQAASSATSQGTATATTANADYMPARNAHLL